jgi:hypothetical protein
MGGTWHGPSDLDEWLFDAHCAWRLVRVRRQDAARRSSDLPLILIVHGQRAAHQQTTSKMDFMRSESALSYLIEPPSQSL